MTASEFARTSVVMAAITARDELTRIVDILDRMPTDHPVWDSWKGAFLTMAANVVSAREILEGVFPPVEPEQAPPGESPAESEPAPVKVPPLILAPRIIA